MLITISRQLGSGGSYIGQRIAQRLGLHYVDREILKEASEHLKEDEDRLSFREERVTGFIENVLRSFIFGTPDTAYVPPPIRSIYDLDLFRAEAEIINRIADKYGAVIIGRAGFHILKDRPDLLNLFIHARYEFRVARIMETYDVSDSHKAVELIRESDNQRRRFIKTVADSEWTDARNYNLCIETSSIGLSGAEDIIVEVSQKNGKRPGI